MPDSNLRQADVPAGATPIPQELGTAPGLICPVGHKVVYALPGVPYELSEMFTRACSPICAGGPKPPARRRPSSPVAWCGPGG